MDSCMKAYSSSPGATLQFMASQSACLAYTWARTKQLQAAALCMAKEARQVKQASYFESLINRCYESQPVPKSVLAMPCFMSEYLSIRTQEEMVALWRKCGASPQ